MATYLEVSRKNVKLLTNNTSLGNVSDSNELCKTCP